MLNATTKRYQSPHSLREWRRGVGHKTGHISCYQKRIYMKKKKHDCEGCEVLYEAPNGAVIRCKHCLVMQVVYGTSHYILEPWQLVGLEKKIDLELKDAERKRDPKHKQFSIPVEHHVSRLYLNKNEALELRNILQQALWMASVMDIISE